MLLENEVWLNLVPLLSLPLNQHSLKWPDCVFVDNSITGKKKKRRPLWIHEMFWLGGECLGEDSVGTNLEQGRWNLSCPGRTTRLFTWSLSFFSDLSGITQFQPRMWLCCEAWLCVWAFPDSSDTYPRGPDSTRSWICIFDPDLRLKTGNILYLAYFLSTWAILAPRAVLHHVDLAVEEQKTHL